MGTGTGASRLVRIALTCMPLLGGCGTTTSEEQRRPTTPEAALPEKPAEAPRKEGMYENPDAISPEKFEELNAYFYRKAGPLQYNCYGLEADRTKKKFQGNLSLMVMIQPGGKASEVKVIESTLKSPAIEACVIKEIKGWEWPDVPSAVPFNGSIAFKPAW